MTVQLKHGKFAFSDLNQAKKCIFVNIQQIFIDCICIQRGQFCIQQLVFKFLASFLAHYDYTEFYVTKKTLTQKLDYNMDLSKIMES